MRIALVHDHVGGQAGGGGGVRQLLELAVNLRRAGHDVTIACHDFEPGTEHEDASREVDVRSVREGRVEVPRGRLAELRRARAMRKVADLVPADAEVVNAHESPGLRAGRLAARRLGVPLVWTRNDETIFERGVIPGETIFGSRRPVGRAVRAALDFRSFRDARSAAAIAVLDSRNARMVERSYRRPARVIRSGPSRSFFEPVEREAARARLGVPPGAFVAAGVGILFPHRRFEDLIEAVALMDDRPDVRVLVTGSDHADPDYADRLAELIDRRGLGDRAVLRRQGISDSELRDVYAGADAFVFPNERQTWGLAPLEALAAGTPAVVSSGAGVHEVLEGRSGVHVVPPGRPEAIASALRELADGGGDDVRETTAWIRTELSNERYAERMVEIFREAIARKRSGTSR